MRMLARWMICLVTVATMSAAPALVLACVVACVGPDERAARLEHPAQPQAASAHAHACDGPAAATVVDTVPPTRLSAECCVDDAAIPVAQALRTRSISLDLLAVPPALAAEAPTLDVTVARASLTRITPGVPPPPTPVRSPLVLRI